DCLAERPRDLAALLQTARLVLILDVGGGTTDLTLLKASPPGRSDAGRPRLERIAVGGHLMLGGDNMDAALARYVLEKANLERRLDASEWSALVRAARPAKEQLLGAAAPAEATVAIQRRGARLVAGTRSQVLTREEVRRLLVDGFLPLTSATDV